MKKSTQVPATLIVTLAAGFATDGCGSSQNCVDSYGRMLPDSYCHNGYMPGAHYIPSVRTGGFGSGSGGFFGGG